MRAEITPYEFWHCGIPDFKIIYTSLLEEISDANIDTWAITASREGRRIRGVNFIPLAPPHDYRQLMDRPHDPTHQDVNNVSGVILMRYGDSRIMLGADAQSASWGWIESNLRDEMRAQVLKVSHHGSIYGTVQEHIERRIVPTYAIISGPDSLANPVKLPHPNVVSILSRRVNQSNLYCTADHGNIRIVSDDNGNHRITP
jgi:beta-lactamase superfamily II metal-dependent hydrolase